MLNTSASPSKNIDKKEMVKRKRKQQEWQMQISCVIRKRENLNLFNPFWRDPHNLIVGAASTRQWWDCFWIKPSRKQNPVELSEIEILAEFLITNNYTVLLDLM